MFLYAYLCFTGVVSFVECLFITSAWCSNADFLLTHVYEPLQRKETWTLGTIYVANHVFELQDSFIFMHITQMQLWILPSVSYLENSPLSGLSMDLVTFSCCCLVTHHLLEFSWFSVITLSSPAGTYSDRCMLRWGPHLRLKVKARPALDACPSLHVLPPHHFLLKCTGLLHDPHLQEEKSSPALKTEPYRTAFPRCVCCSEGDSGEATR